MSKSLRTASYLLSCPISIVLLFILILGSRRTRWQLFVLPNRVGTIFNYYHWQFMDRSESSARSSCLLFYPEIPKRENREITKILARQQNWRRIPRSIGVPLNSLIKILGLKQRFVFDSPNVDQLFDSLFYFQRSVIGRNIRSHFCESFKFEPKDYDFFDKLGISNSSKVVAILNRDNAYLDPIASTKFQSKNEFRNSSIRRYLEAAELLASAGYTVVRIGRESAEILSSTHQKVIDYSRSPLRCDRGDVLLAQRADALLTSSTGIDMLYNAFGVRSYGVNIPYFGETPQVQACLPKHLNVEVGGSLLELPIIAMVHHRCTWRGGHPFWDQKPVQLEQNSSDEILEVAQMVLEDFRDTDSRTPGEVEKRLLDTYYQLAEESLTMRRYQKTRFDVRLPPSVVARFFEADISPLGGC